MMSHPQGEPEQVGICREDLQRRAELLAQPLLVVGRLERLAALHRELGAQVVEELLGEGAEEVVAVAEVLVERRARDARLPGDAAGGDARFAAGEDERAGRVEQAPSSALFGLAARQ
jgi:hypothetical protein